ncbi:MAG: NDP-sugar synthase, partial [Candidatus Electrothrix sp.]
EVILQHEKEVLGTGGGLRKALEYFKDGPGGPNEPVLVMNGDIYHDIDLSRLVTAHAASKDAVTMALHDFPRFNSVLVQQERVRDFLSSKEALKKIKEEGAEEQTLLAFTGIHIVNREVLEAIPQECFFHIIGLYKELATAGKVGYTRIDGSFWQDMGTPDDYLDLHRHLLSSRTPSWQIHESAKIGKNVKLKEWGVIGPRAVIGDGAQLARCVVWEDAEIAAGARLADEIIVPAPI